MDYMNILEDAWNDEIYEDIEPPNYDSVVVYSRDWTVETIVNQIENGNIDLDPKFQRRNAWNDEKRSRLIESLVIGVPVPEIVLAEHPERRKSFLVIDGKQRLLTILGFVKPEVVYWDRSRLTRLRAREDLNRITYEEMCTDAKWEDELRSLMNSSIRCTVVSNFHSNDVLYDIFYRINSGSEPLSTQELRQVLNRGPFADALIEHTNQQIPLHKVMRLSGPDARLRDAELVLRSLAIDTLGEHYRGNLKRFLDDAMAAFTRLCIKDKHAISDLFQEFDSATARAIAVLGEGKVGRKCVDGRWETRFNRSIFEAEIYYFSRLPDEAVTEESKSAFVEEFEKMSWEAEFRAAVEATTKTNDSYAIRFGRLRDLFNKVFRLEVEEIPVKRRRTD